MKFKRTLLIICIFICFFTIASVCAYDVNETAYGSEGTQIEVSQNDNLESVELENDNLYLSQICVEEDKLKFTDSNDKLKELKRPILK